MIPLLSLWNLDSHTFIGRFHEFTPTLLDVHTLLHVPVAGAAPLMVPNTDLSDEETHVVSLLHHGGVQAYRYGHPSLGAWVAFFRARYLEDQNTYIVAILAVWLDQFVFPSSWKGHC